MKRLLLLFAALALVGCRDNPSPEGYETVEDSSGGDALVKVIVISPDLANEEDLWSFFSVKIKAEAEGYSSAVFLVFTSAKAASLREKYPISVDEMTPRESAFYKKHMVGSYSSSKSYWHVEMHPEGSYEGPFSYWVNGQKTVEGTYKEGKEHGLGTMWHKNGQKRLEGTFKDGEPDGLQTTWHENGQKQAEVTIKDGKELSAKYWNRKGEEVETREEARK